MRPEEIEEYNHYRSSRGEYSAVGLRMTEVIRE